MRGRRHLVLVASVLLGPAYLACQLVDPESDLEGAGSGDSGVLHPDVNVGDASARPDATTSDAAPADTGPAVDADAATSPTDAAPVDAAPFCAGQDATTCDGFDQPDGLVDAMAAPYLEGTNCDTGSIVVTGGRLRIDHPINDGTRFSTCVLEADPPGATGQFTLQFDFSYDLPGGYVDAQVGQLAIISSVAVTLSAPNDAGLLDIDFQLLLGASGQAQYLAIARYPDSSKTPPPNKGTEYPTYHLAEIVAPGQWLAPETNCRIVLTGNSVAVTGSATATCNGVANVLPKMIDPPPPGLSAPAVLSLGYTESEFPGTWPEWTVSYDDLLFTTGP